MKPRPTNRKAEAIKELKALALAESRRKYPSLPDEARTVHRYEDRTSNGLTRCILDFLRLKGHQAERVAVTGRYLDQSKVVTDAAGFTRRIGSGKWLPSSMQPGTADISATIAGKSLKIEVKIKDRQSEAQAKYQRQIEAAGGIYLLIRNFDYFLTWYRKFR